MYTYISLSIHIYIYIHIYVISSSTTSLSLYIYIYIYILYMLYCVSLVYVILRSGGARGLGPTRKGDIYFETCKFSKRDNY